MDVWFTEPLIGGYIIPLFSCRLFLPLRKVVLCQESRTHFLTFSDYANFIQILTSRDSIKSQESLNSSHRKN